MGKSVSVANILSQSHDHCSLIWHFFILHLFKSVAMMKKGGKSVEDQDYEGEQNVISLNNFPKERD